ncbi:MAG: molybdopterin-dependent oxidoreductase [Curvibacter sp.]
MHKRGFLTALGSTALATAAIPAAGAPRSPGPALLTLTGAIGRGNRGPLDPALDQMMAKQQLRFDRAHTFDYAALLALPAQGIRPTLEYDAKVHALRGPLLVDVLQAAGVAVHNAHQLVLRAIDGYTVNLTLAQARRYRFIVATQLDERPMPLGGLGPLWAVFDADRHPDVMARPLAQRYAQCPWGLYHIEVQATQAVG